MVVILLLEKKTWIKRGKTMNNLFFFLTSSSSETANESTSNSTDKLSNTMKGMIKSPIFYAVIGGLVLLIILVYLLKRFVKARPNTKTIVVRKGQIYKIIDESNPSYYLRPFMDRIGAVVSLNDRTLTSDKLFINNGPDHLYQINFSLIYKVIDAEEYFKAGDNIEHKMLGSINDTLREYADKGNALVLVKDYREHTKEILDLINNAIAEYSLEASSYKVNLIQPLGR